jgi:hypothetical protein
MHLIDVHKLELTKLFFAGTFVLFLLEQVFYWFLGSYPYRYGISFKSISNQLHETSSWLIAKKMCKGMAIRVNEKSKDIYLRYKYPTGVIGPVLFVGQIKNCDRNVLIIRIGPFSAIFLAYLFIDLLVSFRVQSLFNFLVIVAVIVWLYFRFLNSYKECIDNAMMRSQ